MGKTGQFGVIEELVLRKKKENNLDPRGVITLTLITGFQT